MNSIKTNVNNPQITLTLTNIPENLQVNVNGEIYDLVKREIPKEPELNTFEDCWNKVNPRYWIRQNDGSIATDFANHLLCGKTITHLPSEKTARQIQAAIKLFVVWAAINGEWSPLCSSSAHYIIYNAAKFNDKLYVSGVLSNGYFNPYPFKTPELAQKAIDIAEDIWLQYFGIENNDKS